jgi:predicted metal-binding protein
VLLIDELLSLFESGNVNKITYKHLIILRHKIRNTLSDELVLEACKDFYERNQDRLLNNDMTVFNDSPFSTIIEFVWNDLCPANKDLVWKWGQNIIANFLC